MTTTVLTVLLSNAIVASWLKPDWLHRLVSVGAKPKGLGTPMKDSTEAFINSYAPPIWHGETTHEFKAMVRRLVYEEGEAT